MYAKSLIRNSEGKRTVGGSKHKLEGIIKMDPKEI
jgi:hypothetical protein